MKKRKETGKLRRLRPARNILHDLLTHELVESKKLAQLPQDPLEGGLIKPFNRKKLPLYKDLIERKQTLVIRNMVKQDPKNEFLYLISIATQNLSSKDELFRQLLFHLIKEHQIDFFKSIVSALKSSDVSLKIGACKCLRFLRFAQINRENVLDRNLLTNYDLTDISLALSEMLHATNSRLKIETLFALTSLADNLALNTNLKNLPLDEIISFLDDPRVGVVAGAAALLDMLQRNEDVDISSAFPKLKKLLRSKSYKIKSSCVGAICCISQVLLFPISEAFPELKTLLKSKDDSISSIALLSFSSAFDNDENIEDYIPSIVLTLKSSSGWVVEPAVEIIEKCVNHEVAVPVEDIKKKIPALLLKEDLKDYGEWLSELFD